MYQKLTEEAMSHYDKGEFKTAAELFSSAFAIKGDMSQMEDHYNAARSWALANVADSAFYHLDLVVNKGGYSNYNHFVSDNDLTSLGKDKRWGVLRDKVMLNKEALEVNLDRALVARLDSIYLDDQRYRKELDAVADKHGWDSQEVQFLRSTIKEKDSINLVKVKKILDERGWLGKGIIGGQGNTTLFLVIQHADIATQRKYLPMMREAVKNGNANASNLALLEDRVALGIGKKQIYGSQIGRNEETGENYVLPLEDPDNVDARRASVGLGSLQNYVSRWKITWDLEDYKQKLPLLEKHYFMKNPVAIPIEEVLKNEQALPVGATSSEN